MPSNKELPLPKQNQGFFRTEKATITNPARFDNPPTQEDWDKMPKNRRPAYLDGKTPGILVPENLEGLHHLYDLQQENGGTFFEIDINSIKSPKKPENP